MMMKTLMVMTAAVALAGLAQTASAQSVVNGTVTATATAGTPSGDVIIDNFDNGPSSLASGYTLTDNQSVSSSGPYTSGIYTASVGDEAAAPSNNSSAGYFAVLSGADNSPVTLTSTTPLSTFSLDIGSLDSYNTISFFNGATEVGTFTGSDLSGTGVAADASNSSYFNFTFGAPVTSVQFSTGENSFEFDDLATSAPIVVSATPEPATWGLMFAGLAMAGGALRYRRRNVSALLGA